MRLRPAAAVVLAAGASIVLAACGGGAHKPDHGARDGASAADAVRFSQCMRTHGLTNFPDVIANQGLPIQHQLDGSVDILINGVPQPVSAPAFNAAMSACARYARSFMGNAVGGGTVSNLQKALVRSADCMRSNGVPNYPDPPALGTVHMVHMSLNGRALSAGINVDSPAFKRAAAKCGSIVANAINGG